MKVLMNFFKYLLCITVSIYTSTLECMNNHRAHAHRRTTIKQLTVAPHSTTNAVQNIDYSYPCLACCFSALMCSGSLIALYNNYPQTQSQTLDNGHVLAQNFCPEFLSAPKNQIMTDGACFELVALEKKSNQQLVKDLQTTLSIRGNRSHYQAVMSAFEAHANNIVQIAVAQKICGCFEDKKNR